MNAQRFDFFLNVGRRKPLHSAFFSGVHF
jgi:hypothetical protein